MWIGPSPARAGITASSSGATARRLWGATPATAPSRPAVKARQRPVRSENPSRSVTNRRWPCAGRLAAKPGVGVEDRQQGQADPRRRGRRDDPAGDLGDVVIGRARRIVVQIMKLADAGEAALQHLQEGQGGDGLDLLRPAPVQKAIHQRPPGPEVVVRRPARLGQARHRALKGVAVQIGHPGQRDAAARVRRLARHAGLHPGDPPARQPDPHPFRPAVRQQGGLEPEAAIHRVRFKGHWTGPRLYDQYV